MNTEEGAEGAQRPREDSKTSTAYDPFYAATVEKLRSDATTLGDWIPLVLLAIVMALPSGDDTSFSVLGVVTTIGAFFIHDLSSWGALHLLGVPDTSDLLLPFLRRARPRESRSSEGFRLGLVLLFGDLPGLVMALVFAVVARAVASPDVGAIAFRLAIIHAFWLLPFGFMHGGRLLNIVIFSRSRIAEYIFLGVTSAALIALAIRLELYVIAVFSVIPLLGLARHNRINRAAKEMAERFPGPPGRVEDLDDERMRGLFDVAHAAFPKAAEQMKPAGCAKLMREIHAKVALVPPSALWSLLLLGLYVGWFILAVVSALLTASMLT